MRTITQKELQKILENHQHWLKRDCDGWKNMCADLHGADLVEANLRGADLHSANLSEADLKGADLRCANLRCVNLKGADLRCANLKGADLRGANLSDTYLKYVNLQYASLIGANLVDANLRDANLRDANLRWANLVDANLRDANLIDADLTGADLTGASLFRANLYHARGELLEYRRGKILTEPIIGYKKCENDIIVKLEIPRGAIVFSINGGKCRTNKAKVLDIYLYKGKEYKPVKRAISLYKYMSYYVGDEFTIYDFNCEYNKECGKGIHFFLKEEQASNY